MTSGQLGEYQQNILEAVTAFDRLKEAKSAANVGRKLTVSDIDNSFASVRHYLREAGVGVAHLDTRRIKSEENILDELQILAIELGRGAQFKREQYSALGHAERIRANEPTPVPVVRRPNTAVDPAGLVRLAVKDRLAFGRLRKILPTPKQ